MELRSIRASDLRELRELSSVRARNERELRSVWARESRMRLAAVIASREPGCMEMTVRKRSEESRKRLWL